MLRAETWQDKEVVDMYRRVVDLEQAIRLLREHKYGIAVDAYGDVYLAPSLNNPIIDEKTIDLVSRVVDINNHEVLVADGMVPEIWDYVCKLDERYRDDMERELRFRIPRGTCGVMLSQEELRRLGAIYKA